MTSKELPSDVLKILSDAGFMNLPESGLVEANRQRIAIETDELLKVSEPVVTILEEINKQVFSEKGEVIQYFNDPTGLTRRDLLNGYKPVVAVRMQWSHPQEDVDYALFCDVRQGEIRIAGAANVRSGGVINTGNEGWEDQVFDSISNLMADHESCRVLDLYDDELS